MNSLKWLSSKRVLPAVLAICSLALAGCLEERLVWSPDGTKAAVLTEDGLYLSDLNGRLSGMLLPGVSCAAWMPDGRRLLVARVRKVSDSASLTAAIGREKADAISARAEGIWAELNAGLNPKELKNEEDSAAMTLFLHERHDVEMGRLLGEDWKKIRDEGAAITSICMAEVRGEKVEAGPPIVDGLDSVAGIRVNSKGDAFAFTVVRPHRIFALHIASPIGGAPELVSEQAGRFPDWAPSGRSLEYLASSDEGEGVRFGTLSQVPVSVDAGGRVKAGEVVSQVDLLFNSEGRIRCLPDGRVVFAALAYRSAFPAAHGKAPLALFAFSPNEGARLIAVAGKGGGLPEAFDFFEPSPDGSQIAVASQKGELAVLTLANGKVERISPPLEKPENLFSPCWRGPGELTYAKATAGKADSRPAEAVLRSPSGEKVLSASWPDEVMRKFLH